MKVVRTIVSPYEGMGEDKRISESVEMSGFVVTSVLDTSGNPAAR